MSPLSFSWLHSEIDRVVSWFIFTHAAIIGDKSKHHAQHAARACGLQLHKRVQRERPTEAQMRVRLCPSRQDLLWRQCCTLDPDDVVIATGVPPTLLRSPSLTRKRET